MAEKRSVTRVRKRLQLRFGKDGFSHLGFTDDISHDGLFVRSTLVLPPQTELHVQIMAAGETIELKGCIMWARKVPQNLMSRIKGGMGLRIIRFDRGEELYRELVGT